MVNKAQGLTWCPVCDYRGTPVQDLSHIAAKGDTSHEKIRGGTDLSYEY